MSYRVLSWPDDPTNLLTYCRRKFEGFVQGRFKFQYIGGYDLPMCTIHLDFEDKDTTISLSIPEFIDNTIRTYLKAE